MQVPEAIALGQQQPRGSAGPGGAGGDQRFGQVKVEVGQFHGFGSPRTGGGRRKISRNMPGVRIDSGLTSTCGF